MKLAQKISVLLFLSVPALTAHAQTHQLVKTRTLGEGRLSFVSNSPSGKYMVLSTSKGLRLVESSTGNVKLELENNEDDEYTPMVFDSTESHLGLCVASTCSILDLQTGKTLQSVEMEEEPEAVGFLNGELVLQGYESFQFMDVETGELAESENEDGLEVVRFCDDRGFLESEGTLYHLKDDELVPLDLPVSAAAVYTDETCTFVSYLMEDGVHQLNVLTNEDTPFPLPVAGLKADAVLDLNPSHLAYVLQGVVYLHDLAAGTSIKLPFDRGYISLNANTVYNFGPTFMTVLDLQGKSMWKKDFTPSIFSLLLDGQTLWMDTNEYGAHALSSMNLSTGALTKHLELQKQAAFLLSKVGNDLFLTSAQVSRYSPKTGKVVKLPQKVSLSFDAPPVYSKAAQGKFYFRADKGMMVQFDPATSKSVVMGKQAMKGLAVSSKATYAFDGKGIVYQYNPKKNTFDKTNITIPAKDVYDLVHDVKNNRLYAVANNTRKLFVYDFKTRKWGNVLTGTQASTLTLSPTGQFLVLKGQTEAQLWNTAKLTAATNVVKAYGLSGVELNSKEDTLYISHQEGFVDVYTLKKK